MLFFGVASNVERKGKGGRRTGVGAGNGRPLSRSVTNGGDCEKDERGKMQEREASDS